MKKLSLFTWLVLSSLIATHAQSSIIYNDTSSTLTKGGAGWDIDVNGEADLTLTGDATFTFFPVSRTVDFIFPSTRTNSTVELSLLGEGFAIQNTLSSGYNFARQDGDLALDTFSKSFGARNTNFTSGTQERVSWFSF